MTNLGLQNNNAGNLKDPTSGNFRKFSSPEEGYQALVNDLKIKQTGGSSHIKPGASIKELGDVWAPPSDNNVPGEWANNVSKALGVDSSHPFDQIPTEQLAKAIQVAEGTSTPQVGSTSSQTLAQKIKAKYPQYQDVPDEELTQKILAKYPQYKDMAGGAQDGNGTTERKSFTDSVGEIQKQEEANPEPAPKRGLLGSIIHGIVEPVATTAARPIQAIAEGLGASGDTVDKVTKSIAGDYVAPTPKNAKDVLKDVGRTAETIATIYGGAQALEGAGAIRGALAAKNTALGSKLIQQSLLEQLGPGEKLSSLTKPQLQQILESIVKETPMSNMKLINTAEQAIKELGGQTVKTPGFLSRGLKFGLGVEGANLLRQGSGYLKNKVIDNAYQK